MTTVCFRRLQKELVAIQKNPVEHISTTPNENNLLEWHYVIEGPPGTVYEGGFYHGVLRFPKEYPYKPPSIMMFTRNGRFKQNVRLCLSMSDYHPESWNPMWSVSSILSGLMSFMLDNQSTLGSMEASDEQRRQYARQSLAENVKNPIFRKLFPKYVSLAEERARNASLTVRVRDGSISASNGDDSSQGDDLAAPLDPLGANLGQHNEHEQDQRGQGANAPLRRDCKRIAVAVGTLAVAVVAIAWGILINNRATS